MVSPGRLSDAVPPIWGVLQSVAVVLVRSAFEKPCFADASLGQKLASWKLNGIPAHLECKEVKNLGVFSGNCSPRVLAAYFRSVCGGRVTNQRMISLLQLPGLHGCPCVLACGWDEDCLRHYDRCQIFWAFLSETLGVPMCWRSEQAFLLSTAEDVRLKFQMAKAIYLLRQFRY